MESNNLLQAEQSRREGWEAHPSNSFHSCFQLTDLKLLQREPHNRLQGPAQPNSHPAMGSLLPAGFQGGILQGSRKRDSLIVQMLSCFTQNSLIFTGEPLKYVYNQGP